MTINEAYTLGLEHGKKVAGLYTGMGATFDKVQQVCRSRMLSEDHPLAHTEYNTDIQSAFYKGEADGVKQVLRK